MVVSVKMLFISFCLLFLSGCIHLPNHSLTEMHPTPTLSGEIEQALSSEFFKEGDFPDAKWWELFQDETLSSLIAKGLKNNPSLAAMKERLAYAAALARKERASLFPHLNFDYTEDWEHLSKYGLFRDFFPLAHESAIPHQYNQIDVRLNFSYEFDFWEKNQNLFKAALGRARAERLELAERELLLSIQIAHTYVHIQTLLAELTVLHKQLKKQDQLLSLHRKKQEKGIDSIFPVIDSEEAFEELFHLENFLRGEIQVQEHFLHTLLGMGPEDQEPLMQKELLAMQKIALPQNISSDLLARRPDIQAQIHRVEACAHLVGAAKADFYPNVNLLAFAGLESLAFGNLFKIGSRAGGLLPAIHLPLFQGGQIKANLKAKTAEFNQSVHLYHELLLHAVEQVANALFLLQTKGQDVKTYQEQVFLKERLLFLNTKKVEAALNTAFDVLQAQEALLAEELRTLQAKESYLFTLLDLIRSLGGGFHREISP